MKTVVALVTALSLAALAAPAVGAATVTVTLDVTLSGHDYTTCDVAVPAGADGGQILDAAVAQGCLRSWSSGEFDGFGRYVDCIDNVCGAIATYWAIYDDGEYSDVGIDSWKARDGAVLGFDYQQWLL